MESIGVTSAKIEGRMKRPEYVASAVKACYEKREKGFISTATMENLKMYFLVQVLLTVTIQII